MSRFSDQNRASDVDPKCPEAHGKIIQNGGKKWKIFCELSQIAHPHHSPPVWTLT